jgi:hypothetical protein
MPMESDAQDLRQMRQVTIQTGRLESSPFVANVARACRIQGIFTLLLSLIRDAYTRARGERHLRHTPRATHDCDTGGQPIGSLFEYKDGIKHHG